MERKISKLFWIISWTDSNLFLIELIFKFPKSKFLCLDFVFFKKEKERFSIFIWFLPLSSKVSWDNLFENLEFGSVSRLSLSKTSFSSEILCQISVFRARIKLSTKIIWLIRADGTRRWGQRGHVPLLITFGHVNALFLIKIDDERCWKKSFTYLFLYCKIVNQLSRQFDLKPSGVL